MKYPKGYKGGTQTERLEIRLSPEEKESLISKAEEAHLSVTRLLLCSALDKKIIDTTKLPALIIEIRRIGTNINQIAAVANSQKYISKEMLAMVEQHEKEILSLLRQILNEVYDTEEHTLKSLEHKVDKILKNQNS